MKSKSNQVQSRKTGDMMDLMNIAKVGCVDCGITYIDDPDKMSVWKYGPDEFVAYAYCECNDSGRLIDARITEAQANEFFKLGVKGWDWLGGPDASLTPQNESEHDEDEQRGL